MCNIISTIMTAKAKFKGMLKKNKLDKINRTKNAVEAQLIIRQQQALTIIDKNHNLNQLHRTAKVGLTKKMKFTMLKKGDIFHIRNFPNMDFTVIAEGRMDVKWYNLSDIGS